MGWLTDLVSFRKRFCCNENAKRQRIAQKWDAAKNQDWNNIVHLTDRAKNYAEFVIEHTPTISRFKIHDAGVDLEWEKGEDTLTLFIHATHKDLDMLVIHDKMVTFQPPTVEKINKLLGEN